MSKNLEIALTEALDEEFSWLDSFDNPYAEYTFSPKFESNMERIIPKCEFTYVSIGKRRIRKSLMVIVFALLAFAITGCAAIIYYVVEWNETQNYKQGTLDVNFDVKNRNVSDSVTSAVPKTPQGYDIINETQDGGLHTIEYINNEGLQIIFSKHKNADNMGVSIDNENAEFEEVTINGQKGYSYSKEGINALYWTDGINFYVLQGTCDMKILKRMSDSVY